MTNLTHARERSTIPLKLALPVLLVGALLSMGAKWAEKPIESLASVAGEWRGSGTSAGGKDYSTTFIFKEDGSFDYGWIKGKKKSERGERPPGTVRLNGGKLEWKSPNGLLRTVTLYEDKKGKRMLRGRREDGNSWQLKEKK